MSTKFIQINSQLLKILSNSTYRVFCILVYHSNSNYECYPSIRRIEKEYKISTKTIQRAIDDLVEMKIITKESRKTDSGKITSNLYKINREYVIERKTKKRGIIPNWFGKEVDEEKATLEEQEEMKRILGG